MDGGENPHAPKTSGGVDIARPWPQNDSLFALYAPVDGELLIAGHFLDLAILL
jgi:hypothetical protein